MQVSGPRWLRRPPWGGQIEGVRGLMTLERFYLRVRAALRVVPGTLWALR